MSNPTYFLRPVTAEDADMLLTWRNTEHVLAQTLSAEPILPERHKEWIKKCTSAAPTHYIFSSAQRPLGIVGVKNITESKECEWGFHFGVTDAPRGAATHMLSAFLKIAFETMQMNRLFARVLVTNEKSIYLHEKLGFIRDDIRAGEVNRHGSPVDVIYYHYDASHWRDVRGVWQPITSSVAIEGV